MIDAELRSLDWFDELPRGENAPASHVVYAEIGLCGEADFERFELILCNPAWLAERLQSDAVVWPRGMLIVEKLDVPQIKTAIKGLIKALRNCVDWDQFCHGMNRHLVWEHDTIPESKIELPKRRQT